MLPDSDAAIDHLVRSGWRPGGAGILCDFSMRHAPPVGDSVEFRCDDPIVTKGEQAAFLFHVTHGTVRLCGWIGKGRRQIMGFRGAGSLIGLSLDDRYSCSAEAVGTVRARRIPRSELETRIDRSPRMEQRMLGIVLQELVQAQSHMLLLGRKTALERLVTFLLQQIRQQAGDGGATMPLIALLMNRSDIGDYLGLTTETVSRIFSQLKRDRLIRFHPGSLVEVIDTGGLERIAGGFSRPKCDTGRTPETVARPKVASYPSGARSAFAFQKLKQHGGPDRFCAM